MKRFSSSLRALDTIAEVKRGLNRGDVLQKKKKKEKILKEIKGVFSLGDFFFVVVAFLRMLGCPVANRVSDENDV